MTNNRRKTMNTNENKQETAEQENTAAEEAAAKDTA